MSNKKSKVSIVKELRDLSRLLRKDILRIVTLAKEGHIASALSCIDILSVLYFRVMNINPDFPDWQGRDRFILSKGHASSALYAALARRGFFSLNELDTVGQRFSKFGAHPDKDKVPGIEASSGSLGHGLSIGIGMALAAKRDRRKSRIFVLLGDGECQEGSVWEAVAFAAMHKLDNLVAIIDYNKQQAIGFLRNIVELCPLADKWKAFGWHTQEVNGHDHRKLLEVFSKIPFKKKSPNVIIAHTVKGKGVSFMEKAIMWHARATTEAEFIQALREIEGAGK